jgi:peptidoglycan/LPS O-acetylase OafA/YrhL
MWCHIWVEPSNGYYAPRWMNLLGASRGHLAVNAFIVVSGFVIGMPIARNDRRIRSVGQFLYRRCRRILPPYYAALMLCILFDSYFGKVGTGTVWDTTLPLTWQRVLATFLLVHNLPDLSGGTISYQFWSIAVEFQIYLLAPLLFPAMRRFGQARALVFAIAISVALHLLWPKGDSLVHWYVALFMMGAIAARRSLENVSSVLIPGLVGLGLCTFAIFAMGRAAWWSYMMPLDIAFGACVATVLVGLHGNSTGRDAWLRRLLSRPTLVWIGGFSYSLYLMHALVIHIFWTALVHVGKFSSIQLWLLLLCLAPLIVATTWIFHLVFERPFSGSSQPTRAQDRLSAASP